MKKLHIATSPLTNKIFAGKPLKNGQWGANKEDVTDLVINAFLEHALNFGKPIELSLNGKIEFKITIEDLR